MPEYGYFVIGALYKVRGYVSVRTEGQYDAHILERGDTVMPVEVGGQFWTAMTVKLYHNGVLKEMYLRPEGDSVVRLHELWEKRFTRIQSNK